MEKGINLDFMYMIQYKKSQQKEMEAREQRALDYIHKCEIRSARKRNKVTQVLRGITTGGLILSMITLLTIMF